MANVDAPYGFRLVRTLDGSDPVIRDYPVDSSNSAAIGIGDLVVVEADGNITRAAASPAAGSVIGVAASPIAASTAGSVSVWEGTNNVFSAQTDDGTGTGTTRATSANSNFNLVDTAPVSGVSKQELDESSSNTTATFPFKCIDIYKVVGNAYGEFNQLEVIINAHTYKSVGTLGLA